MIDILMAVYNGEKYLAEQIESILCQTVQDFRLIICDDISEDSSFETAQRYAHQYPDKVMCFRNEKSSGSPQANFMGMLKYASSEYIMFSDQDDVWLPEKLSLTLSKMKGTEKENQGEPVLVHGELEIVDEKLNMIAPCFTEYQGLNTRADSLNKLMVQNNVTGCTVMINDYLFELIKDVPAENMLMHDWWIALTAAAFGKIAFVDVPVVKYRQHSENSLGAVNNRSLKGIARIVSDSSCTKQRVLMTYTQAQNFLEYYKDILPEEKKKCVERYLSIPGRNKLVRAYMLIKNHYLKQNFAAAAGQMIFC